jgi:hypothetical protein
MRPRPAAMRQDRVLLGTGVVAANDFLSLAGGKEEGGRCRLAAAGKGPSDLAHRRGKSCSKTL